MLDLLYEYADAEEKQATVFCEACEIAMDRALLALDTFDRMVDLRARAAEVKYVMEDGEGSVEALMNYYEESGASKASNGAQKQNLIKKAWEAIKNFFTSMINKFKGLFMKKAKKEEAEVPSWVKQVLEKARAVGNAIGGLASNHKGLVTAIGVIMAVVTVKKVSGKVKMKKGEADKQINFLTSISDKLNRIFPKLQEKELSGNEEDQKDAAASRNPIRKFGSTVQSTITTIISAFAPTGDDPKNPVNRTIDDPAADSGLPSMGDGVGESAEDEMSGDDVFGENMLEDFDPTSDPDMYAESAEDGVPDYFNADGSINIDKLMAGL